MRIVRNTYPSTSLYNRILFIHDMKHVVEAYTDDLNYLRNFLNIHDMSTSVCVKLIHIHFHLNKDEILTVHELNASFHEKISFLKLITLDVTDKVYDCNYIVNDSNDLQTFEYTTIEKEPDLAKYSIFVAEFCAAVVQRGV